MIPEGKEASFGSLNPHSIAAQTDPSIQQVQYIALAMIQSAQQNKLFLAPSTQGQLLKTRL